MYENEEPEINLELSNGASSTKDRNKDYKKHLYRVLTGGEHLKPNLKKPDSMIGKSYL